MRGPRDDGSRRVSAFISHAHHSGIQSAAIREALDLIARSRIGQAQLLLQSTLDQVENEIVEHTTEVRAAFAAAWPVVTPPHAPRAHTGD